MKPTRGDTLRCPSREYRQALRGLCALYDPLGEKRRILVIASNRGPVEFKRQGESTFLERGQGGLVTALSSLVEAIESDWVAAPLSPEEAQAVFRCGGEISVPSGEGLLNISFVRPREEEYRAYYDRISNSLLWFLQHGIHDAARSPDFDPETWGDWECYRRVNRLFAEAIAAKCGPPSERDPLIMVHDYHLYLVPGMLRKLLPGALINHFTHISWPGPDLWRQLPGVIRQELFESLLACDVVGFHTPRYVENFLMGCREFLGIEPDGDVVRFRGSVTRVRSYPISIDPEGLSLFAASPEVRRFEEALFRDKERLNILLVARTDPSKNILRSLKSLQLLLERHPKYRGHLTLWGMLPASRQGSEVYRSYLEAIRAKASEIDQIYRRGDWRPVELFFDNSYPRAIAAMKHYDILLVNSLADGMNLVAKEGPIVNTRQGVLLLSEGTGAWDELGPPASMTVNPFDIVGTAEAMDRALSLSPFTRAYMARLLRDRIEENPVFRWAYDQLRDLVEAEEYRNSEGF